MEAYHSIQFPPDPWYEPDPADAAGGQSPRHDFRALLHEATHWKPQAVPQRVLVLQEVPPLPQAGVRIVPLVGTEPGGGRETKHNLNSVIKTNYPH